MKPIYCDTQKAGFYGAWYPCSRRTDAAFIFMMGDTIDGILVKAGVRWLHDFGISVLSMAPGDENSKEHNIHSFPIERFGRAIEYLHQKGFSKIGIAGGSATGMMALIGASYYSDISLTVAVTPCDFFMQGYIRENRVERPAEGESCVTYNGRNLPYLPYGYRHPEYWEAIQKEAKESGNAIASRKMFERSEELHQMNEDEFIKIENISGEVYVIGAEDDCLWDVCRYIRRMKTRLGTREHDAKWHYMTYEDGTHFVFPQTMMRKILPVCTGLLTAIMFRKGRRHPILCRRTRLDIDRKLSDALRTWVGKQ